MKPIKKLPPHSWEAHLLADKGEIKKPYLIMVITLVAMVVLAKNEYKLLENWSIESFINTCLY